MVFNEAVDSTVPFASKAEQQGLTNLTPSAGHQKDCWFTQLINFEPGRFNTWYVATDVLMLIT